MEINMKRKIFLVIPTLGGGGAENLVVNLAAKLNRDLYDVKIICLYGKTNCKEIYLKQIAENNIDVTFLNKKNGIDFIIVLKLITLIRKENPAIIHSHLYASTYVFIAALICKKRFIHTVHNVADRELPKFHRILMGLAYSCNISIPIAISIAVKESMKKLYKNKINCIEVIYNGIDINKFFSNTKKRNNIINFISIGRLTSQKNHKLLLEAFYILSQELNNIQLTILGEGELKTDLETLVNSYNISDKVFFKGYISNIERFLSTSDIFILTSGYEGFGLVIVEAMASELPIIASKVDAIPEIVRDGIDGYLLEANDLVGFVDKMKLLATNKDLRQSLGKNSKKRAEKFSLDEMVNNYEKIYLNFLNGEYNYGKSIDDQYS